MQRILIALALVAACSPVVAAQSPNLLPADRTIQQAIDHYVDAQLKEAKVQPVAQADDATLLRRLTLDLNGRVPTVAELNEYLIGSSADKKAKLIERLIASPAYARHQAAEFFTLLQYSENVTRAPRRNALYNYLLASFNENRSWDQVFKELILPDEANTKQQGANEFLKSRVKDLNRVAIDVSTTFFGVNVSCAQCHDHPHVQAWTQDLFYGMKSFFARTIDNGGTLAEREFGSVKYLPHKGKEKISPILFISGTKIDAPGMKEPTADEKKKDQARLDEAKKTKKPAAPPSYSLRAKLVETALAPADRDYFARNIANRVWHRLMGRGLVMPLDQLHSENPASHPELLQWLARDFAEHGYDLRRLVKGIVSSNAYARGSRWTGDNFPEEKLFAVAMVRPLTPTQMAVSLKISSTDPATLPADRKELEKRIEAIDKGSEKLSSLFAQPGDNFQVGVAEAMLFANNDGLQKELLTGNGTLAVALMKEADLTRRVEQAVRTVLNRPARPEETQLLVGYLQRRSDRADAAMQQVVWALLTSAEMRFNH
jgi:hypothetical protein